MFTFIEFVGALVVIVLGAAFFTNAIEILGGRLNLGQGAVGSVLAAVGTALPESMIAIVAIMEPIVKGQDTATGAGIGIGAILGAPFMLATLAMFVVGSSALVFRRRRMRTSLDIDTETISRDVGSFLIFFTLAAVVGVVDLPFIAKALAALVLLLGYSLYVRRTLLSGGALEEVPERLLVLPRSSSPPTSAVIAQTVVSLALIVAGAHVFVDAVEHAADSFGIPAGLIALVLAPLATELPEKFNSIFWIRDGKDTLALGNISGAMMFQSTVPVAFGIAFTPWELGALNAFSVILALVSGGLVYFTLRRFGKLSIRLLLSCGIFYAIFVVGAIIAIL